MNSVKFTLYEIVGYLVPGLFSAMAFSILFWTLFVPRIPFPVYKLHLQVSEAVAIAIVSYVCGHFTQALGNLLPYTVETGVVEDPLAAPIVLAARRAVASLLCVSEAALTPKALYVFCDEYLIQMGQAGDREMYVYREGFYRGSAVALLLLSIAVLGRLIAPFPALRFSEYSFFLSRPQLGAVLLFLIASAVLAYRRYLRFGSYRVSRALNGFVCIISSQHRELLARVQPPQSPAVRLALAASQDNEG